LGQNTLSMSVAEGFASSSTPPVSRSPMPIRRSMTTIAPNRF
jgi:hypothetical protein